MKENRFVSWVCMRPFWSTVIALLLFVVGIPVLINLCYSCDHVFYVTQWDAADILAFYGTILGAAIAATSLIVTIRFTRKQIEYNSFIKSEYRKWETIEKQIDVVLDTIAPLNMNADFENALNFLDVPRHCVHHLRLYRLNASNAMHRLTILTSSITSPELQKLLSEMKKATDEFCCMASEEIKLYDQIIVERGRCIINNDMAISKCNKRIAELDYQLGNKCVPHYHLLLQEKQTTFDGFYKSIDKEANKQLHI